MGDLKKKMSHCRALAADGDGTLIRGGRLAARTKAALERFHRSGRKLFLTTGESIKELADFPHLELFDLVIAENGAVLYDPGNREERLLARPAPGKLLRALRQERIRPIRKGRVILSSDCSQEKRIDQVLKHLRIGWRVQRNRRHIMIVPSGVSKATGLRAALRKMHIGKKNVVGVGDAENDIALLDASGCGVAVANAVPALKRDANRVCRKGAGSGVVEIVRAICKTDKPIRRKPRPRRRPEP